MTASLPVNALRAFEAVARHMSIRKAADELAVTPSAVSHQLRTLELALGAQLLHRTGAGLTLTRLGQDLAPGLQLGFAAIAKGAAGLRAHRRDGPLKVNMLPTFAIHWLSPRLSLYPFERQGSSLELTTTQDGADLAAGEADVGIWFGSGQWPGLQAELVFNASIDLYASPMHASGSLDERRRHVERSNLFVSRHCHAWEAWMAAFPSGPLKAALVTTVDSSGLTLQAAADGAGVCIAVCELAETAVGQGRVQSLFDLPRSAGAGFWLVYPPALGEDRRVLRFKEWLAEFRGATKPPRTRLHEVPAEAVPVAQGLRPRDVSTLEVS